MAGRLLRSVARLPCRSRVALRSRLWVRDLLEEAPCLMLAVQADGADLATVEGLAQGEDLTPLQQAFQDNHALQCGFCTPGFLMTSSAFLRETPNPTEAQVREAISGNICRCTGYASIVESILQASGKTDPDKA